MSQRQMAQAFGIAGLLGVCLSAQGFVVFFGPNQQIFKWPLQNPSPLTSTNIVNPETEAIRYFLASDAWSPENQTEELNALRASFGQWESVPDSRLAFEEGGLIGPGADVNTRDGSNVVFWVKNDTLVNGGKSDIGGSLGVTFQSFEDDRIVESDIVLNGTLSWFTDFNDKNNPAIFVEGTMLHEIGHMIGLSHSPAGGATMLVRTARGVTPQAGLSTDDTRAAQYLYPASPEDASQTGTLTGLVRRAGNPVFGAAVFLETMEGRLIAGTVSSQGGAYQFPRLPPGDYRARVCPLDPAGATSFLIRGIDIDVQNFPNANTDFQPTENSLIAVEAGKEARLDFNVTPGEPDFRITSIRKPNSSRFFNSVVSAGVQVTAGDQDVWVGVAGPGWTEDGLTLKITGDGVQVEETLFEPDEIRQVFPALDLMSVRIDVAADATPGMRSFVLRRGDAVAYANGFLEIQPRNRDDNFDGLDDAFQRANFPVFTDPSAAPGSDPDGDGFENRSEYVAGTNPNDPSSFLELESVALRLNGATITWRSEPGKTYEVFSREDIAQAEWKLIAGNVPSGGAVTAYLDKTAQENIKFYRVRARR